MGRISVPLFGSFVVWTLLVMLLAVSGCGGGSEIVAGSPAANNADSLAVDGGAGSEAAAAVDSTSLPAVPLESSSDGRSASAAPDGGTVDVLGKDFLLKHNGSVDGDSLVLAAEGGDIGSGENLAFALYKASAGEGQRPLSLNVSALPGGLNQSYWIALADYTSLQWQFFGPVSIPEYQLELTGKDRRYVSALGNVYFLVLCHAGNSCTHFKTTMLTGPQGDGQLPGCPFRLEASDGLFKHKVELLWQRGSAAGRFEVFRRPAMRPEDENAPGDGNAPLGDKDGGGGNPEGEGGDPGVGPEAQQREWRLIAVVQDNRFTDHLVLPGRRYEYRVRAVNARGPSGYSNIDLGWADRGVFDGVIQGMVQVNGEGAPGVNVTLLGLGPEPLHMRTGPQGGYRFDNLPPLLYVVSAQAPDLEFTPPVAAEKLSPGETALINFNGVPATRFGHAWGLTYTWDPIRDDGMGGLRPLADVHIGLWPAQGDESAPELQGTQSSELGIWQLSGLEPGRYKLKAAADGLIFMPPVQRLILDGQHLAPRLDFLGLPAQPPPAGDPGSGQPEGND